ncbi:MAG: hypothetical protein ABI895_08300 [Deltaproteobacteria bacterium]
MKELRSGVLQAERGDLESGIDKLQRGGAAFSATGSLPHNGQLSCRMAAAYRKLGQPQQALRLLNAALPRERAERDQMWEAEVFRLKGELLAEQEQCGESAGKPAEQDLSAESCSRQAIAISTAQGARLLELRAAVSLARYLLRQGQAAQGRARLADVYSWFTEGLDTADLKEAGVPSSSTRSSRPSARCIRAYRRRSVAR